MHQGWNKNNLQTLQRITGIIHRCRQGLVDPGALLSALISCIVPRQITLISALDTQKLKDWNVKMQNDTFSLFLDRCTPPTHKYKIAKHVLFLGQFLTLGLTSTFSLIGYYIDIYKIKYSLSNSKRCQCSWTHQVLGGIDAMSRPAFDYTR